jgi:cytochrome c-type biogenesis protein CcmE
MDPSRKRKIRLVVALTAALLLAGSLVYVSFGSASEAKSPSQLLSLGSGGATYEVTGKVVPGTISHSGSALLFRLRDRAGARSVPVSYTGIVSDTFRGGREVILKGQMKDGVLVGERDSLTTKCPSKFQNSKSGKTL